MAYLILLLGLLLTFFAASQLQSNPAASFAQTLQAKADQSLKREVIPLVDLQEAVEAGLFELEEKNERLQYLLTRQKQQQEAIEKRFHQMEKLLLQTKSPAPVQTLSAESSQRWPQQEVYRLTDKGLAVAEVAAQLGLGRGEVALILGWRKAKN